MTVGIATVAYGEKYHRFLPDWLHSVAGLNRPPDDIVIISDIYPEVFHAKAQEIAGPIRWIRASAERYEHPQTLINEAIEVMDTEWVCKMDVDDMFLPHAFDGIDDCEADVYAFGMTINGQSNCQPYEVTPETLLAAAGNPLFSGSPFRRWIWEESGGFVDILYFDWAFWRAAARLGARFQRTGRIDYFYRIHGDNESLACDRELEERKVRELT